MENNQIILGAGGSFGNCLANELRKYTNSVYLFSRNPKKVNEHDNIIKGNLLNAKQTENALKTMSVAYLVAGLAYSTKVWERDWLVIVKNVLTGCLKYNVALVFLDNTYMYDPLCFNNLTENTPSTAVSKKGTVRISIENLLKEEMLKGRINIQIVRSADFYGKNVKNSMFNEVVIKNVVANKKAYWFISGDKRHSFTLVNDAASATALLGNTNGAYNQVWHLPTDNAYTVDEILKKIETITGKTIKVQFVSRFLTSMLSFFIPAVKESKEMLYQFDRDYIFSSKKFETTFRISPTTIDKGLEEILRNQTSNAKT